MGLASRGQFGTGQPRGYAGAAGWSPYITAMLAKNPDMVWSGLWGGDSIGFIKQAKGYGLFEKVPYMGNTDASSLQALGAEAPEGIYGWDRAPAYAIDTPAMTAFVKAFEAKHHNIPTTWPVYGYESVRLIKWGALAVEHWGDIHRHERLP